MLDMHALASALHILGSSAGCWVWILPGLIIGLAGSAMPGVAISVTMAVVLPLTLQMDLMPSLVFLTSVYTGGVFGGSVPAILMNIPGTPASYATTFDGYPMTLKGEHNEALGYALFSSTLCCIVGYIVLLLVIEPMAHMVIKVGPLEMLIVALWGLALLGSLGSEYVTRGFLAAAFGILISTIGMNTAGYTRGTLGIPYLLAGVSPIAAMIGLLAAGQLLTLATKDYLIEVERGRDVSLRRILIGCRNTLKHPAVLLRGAIIGIILGMVPGTGSAVTNLISYAETKRTSKDHATFGTGNPKGVIAAESAVASGDSGSMATMLSLGIPGHGAVAVLLAAFTMHNVVPGPSLVRNQMDLIYAIILSNLFQAVALLGVGILFIYAASHVVKVRSRYVLPIVFALAIMGIYSVDGTTSGPITMFVFTIIGVAMNRYKYPVSAAVVGILLGRMLETQSILTYEISGGSFGYILQRPAAIVLLAIMPLSLISTALSKRRQSQRAQVESAAVLS
jgi:putative tricarboxylic transport membrane protein